MRQLTDEQKQAIRNLWPDDQVYDGLRSGDKDAFTFGDGYLTVQKHYRYVTVNFEKLLKLSEILGTRDIDTDQASSSGCETCDFGSSYEVTFRWKAEGK